MAELLIVVDSAAKAEFMKEYYEGRADCVVCEWPLFKTSHQLAPGAPSGLLFQFIGLPGGQECLAAIRAFLGKEILLALDENARANYLCWQINGYVAQLGGTPGQVKRLNPAAFNQEGIEAARRLAWPVDERQGLSFYGRLLFDDCLAQHLIRLIGTDRGPANLALRHSSLTTLFLLAEREQERLMFPLAPTWQVQAELTNAEARFAARLSDGLDLPADGLIHNEDKARALRDHFWKTPFVVDSISRSPLTIAPPEPYQLAELLHDAIVLLELELATAMAIINKLFHGVAVDNRPTGLITTSAPQPEGLGPATVSALRRQVATLYGESTLADDDAPTVGMILPVHPEISGKALATVLSQEETALYDLIRNRALSSQMRPPVGETTTIDLLAGKEHIFQAHFHELKTPGFLLNAPAEMARLQTPWPGAALQEGQTFKPDRIECEQVSNEGQTAERYTIETLLAALADFSIAADPVTIAMIDDLIKAGYVTMSKQGALIAADNTSKVVSILDRAFPKMQGINLAAYIEQTITEAASARKDLPFALKQFNQTLMMHGKVLVKPKITAKVQARMRAARTIIKPETPPIEAPPPPLREEPGVAPPPLPTAELPAAATPQALTPPPPSPPPLAAAVPAPEDTTPEPLPAVEEADLPTEPAGADWVDESAPGPEAPVADEPLTSWSDDFKKIFAEALAEAPAPTTSPTADDRVPESGAAPPDQPRRCPVCQRPMLLKEDPFGTFWSCTGFPGCRYSEALSAEAEQGLACPLCDQKLQRRQTPTGKNFYVCEDADCQFMSWSRPHHLPCGLCESPYLVEKTIRGVAQLRCPRAGCPYGQPLAEETEALQEQQEHQTPAPPPVSGPPKTKKVLVRRVAGGTTAGGATRKVRIVRRRTA